MPSFFEGASEGFQQGRVHRLNRDILNEQISQFDDTLEENKRQYDTSFGENQRQFNEELDIKKGYLGIAHEAQDLNESKFSFDQTKYYTDRSDSMAEKVHAEQQKIAAANAYQKGGLDGLADHFMKSGDVASGLAIQQSVLNTQKLMQDVSKGNTEQQKATQAGLASFGLQYERAEQQGKGQEAYKLLKPNLESVTGIKLPDDPKQPIDEGKYKGLTVEQLLGTSLRTEISDQQVKNMVSGGSEKMSATAQIGLDLRKREAQLAAEGYTEEEINKDPTVRAMKGELAKKAVEADEAKEKLNQLQNPDSVQLTKDQRYALENKSSEQFKKDTATPRNLVVYYNKIKDVFDFVEKTGGHFGPADLAIITGFMKSIDDSTVKEGEFANGQRSAGLWESMKAMMSTAVEGGFLSQKLRREFVETAKILLQSEKYGYDRIKAQAEEQAKRRGLNVADAVPDTIDWENIVAKEQKPDINSVAQAIRAKYPNKTDAEIQEYYNARYK